MTHINVALPKFLTQLILALLFVGVSGCGLFRGVTRPETILIDSVSEKVSIDTTLGPVRPIVIPPKNITFVLNPATLKTIPTQTYKKDGFTAGYVYTDSTNKLTVFCNLDSMIILADSLRTMIVTKNLETKQYQTRVVENIALQDSLRKDRQKLLYWLIGIIAINVLCAGVWIVLKIKGAPVSAATKITGAVKKGLDSD